MPGTRRTTRFRASSLGLSQEDQHFSGGATEDKGSEWPEEPEAEWRGAERQLGTLHLALTALTGKPFAARGPRPAGHRKEEKGKRTAALCTAAPPRGTCSPLPGPFPARLRATLHPARPTRRHGSLLAVPRAAEQHRVGLHRRPSGLAPQDKGRTGGSAVS